MKKWDERESIWGSVAPLFCHICSVLIQLFTPIFLSFFTLRSFILCKLYLSHLVLLGFICKHVCLSKSVTWTRRLPASRDERRKKCQGWTPRCIWVGVIMVWEEMDTYNPQVRLLLNKIFSLFCADSWFPFLLPCSSCWLYSPPEHVALFSHRHASQYVFVNTHTYLHTHTSSLTRLVATFLLMHTIVTSTEMKDETFINLTWLWTENAGQWEIDMRSLFWSCFCKTFLKIALNVGSKTCLDQMKLMDQLLGWDLYCWIVNWHSHQKSKSYVL